MAMVRKSAIIGCCSRKVLINSTMVSSLASIHGQSAIAKLPADTFCEFDARRGDICQRVLKPELSPLVLAHLMESKNLHSLNGLKTTAEIGYSFDVIVVVRKARHQDKAYPHGSLQSCQSPCKVERGL